MASFTSLVQDYGLLTLGTLILGATWLSEKWLIARLDDENEFRKEKEVHYAIGLVSLHLNDFIREYGYQTVYAKYPGQEIVDTNMKLQAILNLWYILRQTAVLYPQLNLVQDEYEAWVQAAGQHRSANDVKALNNLLNEVERRLVPQMDRFQTMKNSARSYFEKRRKKVYLWTNIFYIVGTTLIITNNILNYFNGINAN